MKDDVLSNWSCVELTAIDDVVLVSFEESSVAGADFAWSAAAVDGGATVVMGLVVAVVVASAAAGADSVGAPMTEVAKHRQRVMAKVIWFILIEDRGS